jgi:hypothetical protein
MASLTGYIEEKVFASVFDSTDFDDAEHKS